MNQDIIDFLKELTILCEKHGIFINGCGCDGSPWLTNKTTEENYGDNLSYNDEDGYHLLGKDND